MNRILRLELSWILCIYIIIDILCAGAGMGVPIFCILFGFLTGWGIIKILMLRTNDLYEILRRAIKYGMITTLITFLLMLIIWGIAIIIFFNQKHDFENFGHPLILYDPKLSFIGWIVLMILISPFLQLLTTVFSFYMALIFLKKKSNIV